jgi:hypothetical protein
MSSSVLGVYISKSCGHLKEDVCSLRAYNSSLSVKDIFYCHHPPKTSDTKSCFEAVGYFSFSNVNDSLNLKSSRSMTLDKTLNVSDLVQFNVKYIVFTCKSTDSEAQEAAEVIENVTKKTVNAFELMLSGGRSRITKKKTSR